MKPSLSAPRRSPVLALTLATLFLPLRLFAIAGLEGTFEFGLDAPWRMEPSRKADGTVEYGAIPIQITIHGARHAKLDNIIYPAGPELIGLAVPDNVVSLGRFYSVRIKELAPVETGVVEFPLNALFELEFTTGDWPWPPNAATPPFHKICRIWNGEDPEPFREVSATSEWHATLYYVPQNKTPGTTVALQIEVLLERDSWPPPPLEASVSVGVNRIPIKVNFDFSPFLTLRNFVRVFLATDPMPRFDKRWLYGDFHYHSQGTDNEGEAAYNYRGVVRAMGAMGMDFVFATDHASSSEQIVDADLPRVNKIPEIAHSQGDKLTESNVRSVGGVLRDMDADRYAFCHNLIYGAKGVNSEASLRAGHFRLPQNYLSYGVVPQIFLGGELDAVPEVSVSTVQANTIRSSDGRFTITIPYGNGLSFNLSSLCAPEGCDDPRQSLLDFGDTKGYLVRDFQSLESFRFYGREHLVYFPNSSTLQVGNETTFIASRTSRFGGATRRLDNAFIPTGAHTEPLLPEIERKGVVFIAHHLNASEEGSRGPDGVPWTTDHLLLKAFRSPAVLGLEFWNENVRFRTRVCSHDFCRSDGSTYLGKEAGYERNEELEADSNNPIEDLVIGFVSLLGGDLLPKEFHQIALPLEEVRRGFISGGSNGGLFELVPFDVRQNTFQLSTPVTARTLHHGAFDWDMLNLRGLDFEQNKQLSWLKPGEPRKMFMGGGSDAHGDLNYRRAGYFLGTDDANDTAIGKPRNLVFVGDPEGPVIFSQGPVANPGSNSRSPDAQAPASVARQSFFRPPVFPPIITDPPVLDPGPGTPPPGTEPPVTEPPVLDPGPPPPDNSLPGDVRPPITEPPVLEPPVIDPGDPPQPPDVRIPDDIGGPIGGFQIRSHTHAQIIAALRRGRFCVTDGAAIRIAIDLNGNNQIDDSDVLMGDHYSFDKRVLPAQFPRKGQKLTLLTEVMSTPEFGPVERIDVYVGVHPDPVPPVATVPVEPRMYAPLDHGPSDPGPDAKVSAQISYQSNGRNYVRRKDNYWDGTFLGDNVTFSRVPGDPLQFKRLLVTVLDLDKYEVGQGITADRFFVRAFARGAGFAFSNPIWLRRNELAIDPVFNPPDDAVIGPVDPTPAPGAPTIRAGFNTKGQMVISFTGTCQFTPRLTEPFRDLPDAVSPYLPTQKEWSGFFRARK